MLKQAGRVYTLPKPSRKQRHLLPEAFTARRTQEQFCKIGGRAGTMAVPTPKVTTNTVVMVRPANFGFNSETAGDNVYQQQDQSRSVEELQRMARDEFDGAVDVLRSHKVNVIVVEDTPDPKKTDAVFPNNWFSTHEDGTLVLYPMASHNRRLERRSDLADILSREGFSVKETIDLTSFENHNQYLEGTGSLVLDREHRILYAGLSERTHMEPLRRLNEYLRYEMVTFRAEQEYKGSTSPIYHTNVMMHLGSNLAVVCMDSIRDERSTVYEYLQKTNKEVICISYEQLFSFAGNMLEVRNEDDDEITIMSKTAYDSLTMEQIGSIEKYTRIVAVNIPTIEKLGGGSARCMLAEVFLPAK